MGETCIVSGGIFISVQSLREMDCIAPRSIFQGVLWSMSNVKVV